MSRHTNFHFRVEREGRVAQMSKQEEVIARKRLEILEKQKTTELARQVVAAQTSSSTGINVKSIKEKKPKLNNQKHLTMAEPLPPKNNFNNDGSFFENFKKITEAAAKKAHEEKLKLEKAEADRKAKEEEEEESNKQTNDVTMDATHENRTHM